MTLHFEVLNWFGWFFFILHFIKVLFSAMGSDNDHKQLFVNVISSLITLIFMMFALKII